MRLPSLAPSATPCTPTQLAALLSHVRTARNLLVVTGAGISTHSGIPDYRSPHGSYSKGHRPIQHADFVKHESWRRRYWARSFVGMRPCDISARERTRDNVDPERPLPSHRCSPI
jgi:hypothetical protein